MEEREFKDYKEKQRYYKNLLKTEKMVWVSREPSPYKDKPNLILKGRTYVNYDKKKGDK